MKLNVKNKMTSLSARIEEHIKNANRQKSFNEHFIEWWNKDNTECGDIYIEAGEETPSTITPDGAVEWLEQQIKKLHDFLSSYKL